MVVSTASASHARAGRRVRLSVCLLRVARSHRAVIERIRSRGTSLKARVVRKSQAARETRAPLRLAETPAPRLAPCAWSGR